MGAFDLHSQLFSANYTGNYASGAIMDVLFDEKLKRRDTYVFQVNRGVKGIETPSSPCLVKIIFLNGALLGVEIPDEEVFPLRSLWHVKQAITERIAEIENRYKAEK